MEKASIGDYRTFPLMRKSRCDWATRMDRIIVLEVLRFLFAVHRSGIVGVQSPRTVRCSAPVAFVPSF